MVRVLHPSPDVDRLRASLPDLPPRVARPVLVVLSGLPGSGKSYFGRQLAQRLPLLVLESDFLRKVLFATPTYTGEESRRLFDACHSMTADLLGQGIPVLLDSTNLIKYHREHLYRIADRCGAKLIIVCVEAPESVVYERLTARSQGQDGQSHSGADWSVYKKLLPTADPVTIHHVVVDTSRDITPVIENVAGQIERWTRAR